MDTNKHLISSIDDIKCNLIPFNDLIDWCINFTSSKVMILESGIILVTGGYDTKLEIIGSNMARHGLLMSDYYTLTNECMSQVYEKLGLINYDDGTKSKTEDSDEDLTEIRDQLRTIVKDAVAEKVSDIHIEVRKKYALIRFRKNGDIFLYKELMAEVASKLCFVAFNRESDDVKKHFNATVPLDASMELKLPRGPVRVRLASIPAYPYPGFDVVLRILTIDSKVPKLDDLGYEEKQLYYLNRAMKRKNGAIIVAGATGSGKTTTLASMINLIPTTKKVYTIEDPIEKKLPNATQVPTNDQNEGTGFSGLTRQTLRMDPDCVVIGEVRDEDTAKMMSRAAITGHLVLTTLHTNSAINIVLRLKDLGLDMNTLLDPSFLTSLTYQTLIKRLCPDCKIESEHEKHKRFFKKMIYQKGRDKNCLTCGGSGITGRVIVSEVIEMGKKEFQFIKNNDWFAWQEDLISNKQDIKSHAINLINEGIIYVDYAESAGGFIVE
ncbi:MAG: GspE/PulE family protein [Candidatus Lariskella arthropodorum]